MIEWLKRLFGRKPKPIPTECIKCLWWVSGRLTNDGIPRCGKTGRQKRINEYCDCEKRC